ncbi:cytochrome c [Antarcticibacterium arcticum]|uniref:Cytochrome c n=1 Tax=Antarcticibacterium arcticum TaxID=2585771 RepID=A0A5B8YNL5_9FLAO|nr:cytochrome c [Antarcticibacterium arcticum]QED37389.1 cytochrome c [Antarcticibacterium arcticum]
MKIVFKLVLIIGLLSCKSNSEKEEASYTVPPEELAQAQDKTNESYKRGKDVYNDFCVTCHLSNGKGVAGNFPPLDGSDWLTKKRTESIHAIKYGLSGPIKVNGEEYNSVMVQMGLSDQEVADVMNYINNSWSNAVKKPVTLEEVQAVAK